MNYFDFRKQFYDLACFSLQQVYAWKPDFDRNNLSRWVGKGFLVHLKQGFYAFSEYSGYPDYALYFANRIYTPSYISLHTALAAYGVIPELVTQITSVTSLKTAQFKNSFGVYSYKSIKPELLFGYELRPMPDGRALQFAQPEKALLDLLYLYPFYNNVHELEGLRLDEDFMSNDLNTQVFQQYCSAFHCKALTRRAEMLLKIYRL